MSRSSTTHPPNVCGHSRVIDALVAAVPALGMTYSPEEHASALWTMDESTSPSLVALRPALEAIVGRRIRDDEFEVAQEAFYDCLQAPREVRA